MRVNTVSVPQGETSMRRYALLLISILLMVTGSTQAQQIGNLGGFLFDARADLERAANEALGAGVRPETWTFNINNVNSATYVADLWFDNEQLAASVFSGQRPPGWIGAPVTKEVQVVARNIRHDLELTATQVFGPGTRPEDWRGSSPLFVCDRTVMNLVRVLQNAYSVTFATADETANYCQAIVNEAQDNTLRIVLSADDVQAGVPDAVLSVRGDLERLADEELGLNNRPLGWVGNKDRNSPTLISDNYLDLELLADTEIGAGQRPPEWLPTLPGAPIFAARYLRFNIELLADALGYNTRPRGWQGVNPVGRCDVVLQSLFNLTTGAYGLSADSLPADNTFCGQLSGQANAITENPPVNEGEGSGSTEADRFVAEANYAFSYLDSAASQYMGIMPKGTQFKAWYRNFGDSTMMFVSGDQFALYIDMRWTTLPTEIFDRLPTTEGVKPLTFCDASWCNGPGPTPTPTGGGALQSLLSAGTPPAAPDLTQEQTEKAQVSWNYVRVTYLLDNAATRTAQVALEICSDTTQSDCEPVIRVFDKALGAEKPVLSQFNGLNVYEFPYGYTSNLLIEGATRFSQDVWISDPTIR